MDSKRNGDNDTVEYDPEEGVYRAHYDPRFDSPSVVIGEAITAIERKDPTTVEPLYDSVNPDALDRLIQSEAEDEESDIQLKFTAWDYEITINSTDTIRFQPVDGKDDE